MNRPVMSGLRTPWAWAGACALAAWLVAVPVFSDVTRLRRSSEIVIVVLAVLAVNVATGYGGMISLGHGVFVAFGAFATASFADALSLPWVLAILGGAAASGCAGALIGLPALRIKGIHLALVTLGLAIAFQPLAKRFPAVTGGTTGRTVDAEMHAPSWFGDGRYADALFRYLVCVTVVVVAVALVYNLIDSRFGRAMRAVRDNDTAAAVHGVHVVATRVSVFAVSAALAGLAGALQVVLVPFVSQASYPPQRSLVLYATAVIGGLGSVAGSVVGVVLLGIAAALGERLSALEGLGPAGAFFDLLDDQAFVFGVGLVALTFVFPTGVVGTFRSRQAAQRASAVGVGADPLRRRDAGRSRR